MYFDYFNVLVFGAVGLIFVFANLIIASVVRPKRKSETGLETYECGEETIGSAWIQFDIRYYTVALVYVIFAVEIAFLFPWALVLRDAVRETSEKYSKKPNFDDSLAIGLVNSTKNNHDTMPPTKDAMMPSPSARPGWPCCAIG